MRKLNWPEIAQELNLFMCGLNLGVFLKTGLITNFCIAVSSFCVFTFMRILRSNG